MPSPKKPQDHQSKKPSIEQLDGARKVTVAGIAVTVPDDALDDFELVEDLARLQADQSQGGLLPSILRRIVGDDGYRTVMDGLRGPNGRVSVQSGAEWIKGLFEALNPNS